MQVLKAEGAADSTQVFSIFSGMNEVKVVVQPLDLTLGAGVCREPAVSSFQLGFLTHLLKCVGSWSRGWCLLAVAEEIEIPAGQAELASL